MMLKLSALTILFCSFVCSVELSQILEENRDKFKNKRSLALHLAPNKTQNIKAALEQQIFPSALKGSIFIFGSILLFEVVGYTIAGKGIF